MSADVWERVQDVFPHEPVCHIGGCAGYGFCGDTQVIRDASGVVVSHTPCPRRDCDCTTMTLMHFVQRERALVLDQAAEALSQGMRKKPRVARTLLSWARDVRDGLR